MSRSGYSEYCDDYSLANLWTGAVKRAINGKRGQTFLRELADSLDEMPEKRLITQELITESGEVCTIGAVCKSRGLDVSEVDEYEADQVGALVGISRAMAAEIEYENDECGPHDETPEQRWIRIRKWVALNLKEEPNEQI